MAEPTLDWSTAEVKDSKLTVQVEGELPDGWENTFKATVQLLGGGSWGEITLEDQKAQVSAASPGSEEKVKHFLESVVLQANTTHQADEQDDQDGDEQGERDREEDEGSKQESDSDKEMSERFRSFAEDRDSDSDPEGRDSDSGDEESSPE